jgi:hypothetical protein
MLKKIALVGVFAVASIVSFGTSVRAARLTNQTVPVSAPTMQGIRCGSCFC